MKRLIITIALLLSAAPHLAAQTTNSQTPSTFEMPPILTDAQRQAKDELNQATLAHQEGNFAEAQRHSELALILDPLNETPVFLMARTLITRPENIAKARDAIEAYKRILAENKNNEEAYRAVAALYGAIGENDLQRAWITQHALDESLAPEARAEAYIVLASKDWDCSYKVTENIESKQTVESKKSKRLVIRYLKPKDLSEYDKAQACVIRGLEEADKAISLDPTIESAWAYKTNILLEASKLAEMDNNRALRDGYKRQADAVQQRLMNLVKEKSREKPNP
jgi:hypothetical protein